MSLSIRALPCPVAAGQGRLHRPGCRCLLDADPTHQFVRSLAVIGWPLVEQGRRIGQRHGRDFHRILGQARVERGTAVRVACLYEHLWDMPGPSPRTTALAAGRGWDAPDPVTVARLLTDRDCPHRRIDRDQAVRVLLRRGATETAITKQLRVGIGKIRALAATTPRGLAAATLPLGHQPASATEQAAA
jgi:hypothetical protein